MGVAFKSVLSSGGGGGIGVHVDTLTITHNPNTLTYIKDEVIDTTGLVVTATASGMSGTVTQYCTVSPQILDTAGTQPITVSYGDATATFNVTVYAVETVTITSQPTNRTYIVGDTLDLTGIAVRAVAGTITKTVTNLCTYSPSNGSIITEDGTLTITASFGGQSDTTTVTVYVYTNIEFTTPPTKTLYNPYDRIDLTGAVVTGTAGPVTRNVTSICTYNPAEGTVVTTVGNYTITASLNGLTATIPYQVIAVDIVPFATGTWSELKAMLDAHYNGVINIYDFWNVGDEREFTVPANIELLKGTMYSSQYRRYYVQLASKNVKDLTTPIGEHTKGAFAAVLYSRFKDSSSKVVLSKTTIENTNTNVGGWKECSLRQLLNADVKNGIDSGLVSIIKSFKNTQSKGGSDATIAMQSDTVDDYIAIPSAKEMDSTPRDNLYYSEPEQDNVTFELFDSSPSPYYTYDRNNSARVFTRTPYNRNASSYVNRNGTVANDTSEASNTYNDATGIVGLIVI